MICTLIYAYCHFAFNIKLILASAKKFLFLFLEFSLWFGTESI